MFRLILFGSASIDGPAGRVTGRAVQRRRLGLLALLAVAGERGMTRDKLIGFLWPDSDGERARHLLSDSIYRINQAVAGEAVVAMGDDLWLNPERLPSDAREFAEAMERGDWQHAVELHVAPFLDGFFLTDADELERWVDGQRERLARERAHALEALAERAERDGAMVDAVNWWRQLAAQDPCSSRIALRLMRVLDSAGERAAALQHAGMHTQLLADEMGLAPDAGLLAFVEELRTPRDVASAGRTIAIRRAQQSVAVLPFVNLSADPENEYFTDGITEDVIASLSKIAALRVISRTSVMQFKGGRQSLREIGAALGAETLLQGSVRRVAERVRINAQLVCVETDEYLWAETYDRDLTDVFAIQTDVAVHIATALRATLSPEEKTRISREPTGDIEAYQLYLRGRHCFVRFTDAGMRQSITYFERALALDPGYALAHASVAMACAELGMTGHMEPLDAYRRAHAAVAKALELDGDLADAHCMRGQLLASGDYDWVGAERAFMRALELSPSSADTYDLYGRMCSALGRYDEGVRLQKRAQELDPLAHRVDFATALLRAGRYNEALDTAQQAIDFDPHYDRGRATLGWAHLMLGNEEEGLAELEAAVALSPASTAWLAQLGQAYGMTGRTSDARDILRRLDELSRDRYVSPYHMAYVYTGLGDYDKAVAALEGACRERAGAVYSIKGSFLFTSLHGHPGFNGLLRRMNLVSESIAPTG